MTIYNYHGIALHASLPWGPHFNIVLYNEYGRIVWIDWPFVKQPKSGVSDHMNEFEGVR